MPYVKSLRDVRIASLKGYIVLVKAGVPTHIPDAIVPEAQALGCVTCDDKGRIMVGDETAELAADAAPDEVPFLPPEERDDPEKRARVIGLAVAKCYRRNDRNDFTKTNVPKASAITRLVGFPVGNDEVAAAVEQMT